MFTRMIIPSLMLSGLANTVLGQSISNDIPPNQQLEIVYGDGARRIHAPGAQMHPGYMDTPPSVLTPSWPSSSDSSTGMLIMLDLDAPLGDTRVSSLHWLVTGFTLSSSTSPTAENPANLTIPSSSQVQYQQPAPPIGDIAHTYAFYLIAPLPASFAVPQDTLASLARERSPFDLAQFLRDRGLGEESVVARNHFRIRNLKGTPTAGFPGPRVSETGSIMGNGAGATPSQTTAAFEGVGVKSRVDVARGIVVGGLVGLAALF